MTFENKPVDVLVIGAGPSGAVVTHTAAVAGLSVVCLEQGDWVNPSDFPANFPEWELLIQHNWAHDPNVRGLPSDYPVDVSDSDMWPVMFNAVGGSSIYYGAEWPRLLPSDFRVKTLDGVADDWPISYHDLKPYHDEVDEFIGVSGVGGDTAYPEGLDYPLPPHPLGKPGMKAAAAANALGWHWWPGTNAIPSQKNKTLEQCGRWGVCEWGCPQGAKASFDLIYMPQAQQAGAEVVTGARVSKIVTDENGLATGAQYIDRDGTVRFQPARSVVLCANGIGTPRLLLLSADDRHPDGLANSSGLVGKNLMLHPNCTALGYYEEDLESWRGPAGQLIHSMQFYETDASRGFVRGAKLHALPTPGPLNAIEAHRELDFDELWGPAIHDVARAARNGILWAANTEDLPEEHNRVTLSKTLVDSDGLPAPKVEYRVSENTRKLLKFTVEQMVKAHEAAGAKRVITQELWVDQPGHLLGTARMGDDPKTSVVDSYGKCHDVDNLYVADGSIFVTSGSANPTCTITALALRVGKKVVEQTTARKAMA
ncbi:GMC family oxidoreductase [Mycolicibacterium brisbanense]|uniref:Glucose dehydrogenase n=1 Tax=Mycolicibacterium brisbanense TaxID=146020 RepID=A0A117I4L4_9MYCO|nr:GMC family oxidoreductase [Mycolicibacterium brisbanense]MCV7159638.1 GMC family oxidoreductase [Mycolicibacterium brisbanense]GAS87138.1 glucose dehydrogenase [Mycolicibacterium brisbanense]